MPITAREAAAANTSRQQAETPLSNSSAAVHVDKAQPPHSSSLLTRSSNKQQSFLQHESANSGIRSPESTEFKLSPIHTCIAHTGSGLANRNLLSDENSSILSSESASSTSEARGITLTPLHAKQLTASDLFKSTPVSDKINHKTTAISEGRLSTTSLSPLHATGSGVLKQSTGADAQSPERKHVATGSGSLAVGLSPVHTKQSSSHGRQLKVTEHSSPTYKPRDIDNSLLLQLRDTENNTRFKPDIPKESTISIPEDHLRVLPDQSHKDIVEQSVHVQSKPKQEDTAVSSPVKSLLEEDNSGLGEDLAELQSALQAAGLPPMTVNDEETPKDEPSESPWSPKAADVSTKATKIPQSAASVDSKPKPLASFAGDHSESDEQDPVKASGELERPGTIGFDLREAIRVIASEELTSISKEILKQQKHSVSHSQQPLDLQVDHEAASASNDKKSERDAGPLFLRGDGEASHVSTYDGLEKLGDILADIEHDSKIHKSQAPAKYEGSRKPGKSSTRKLTSTLPKASTKALPSNEGPASKVDTRLSSKLVKASDRIQTSSSAKNSYKTSSRLAELAAPKKINKIPSVTSGGSQAKPKHHHLQTHRPGTSKSAPPKHPSTSSDRAGLKQYNRTAANSAKSSTSQSINNSSRQHQIVIPTGTSSALSDSDDEVIHAAAHEDGRKTSKERPEIKVDAWERALQEEKVCSFFTVPMFVEKGEKGP